MDSKDAAYYRRLLQFDVGDEVRWRAGGRGAWMRGYIVEHTNTHTVVEGYNTRHHYHVLLDNTSIHKTKD